MVVRCEEKSGRSNRRTKSDNLIIKEIEKSRRKISRGNRERQLRCSLSAKEFVKCSPNFLGMINIVSYKIAIE